MDPLSALRTALPGGLGAAGGLGGLGALGGMDPAALSRSGANLPLPRLSAADLEKLAQAPSSIPDQVAPTTTRPLSTTETGGGSFSNTLDEFVSDVNRKQAVAAESVNGLLAGKNASLHQTMIALEEASVSFQLMVEVRNKLLESYQELMRMQV